MATGSTAVRFDPDPSDWYPPHLYRFDHLARFVDSAAEVTTHDLDAFARDGYLAVRQLLDPVAVADTLAGIAAVLDHPGKADVQYEAMAAGRLDTATGDDRMDLVRKFMWLVPEDVRLQALARDERILSIVRPLCGSDDVSMIQDMALLKPPGGGREKPWHQDNAYFTFEPGTPIVGVWIALDAATADNGCMHVIPGTHAAGPAPHFRRRDWQLCDDDVDLAHDSMVPLEPGGALFFDGLLQHGTPANRSTSRRRAIQLHYVPMDTERVSDQRRLDIFGGEGIGATC
jgi:phytanoyl-CoA hydroxylase